MGDTNGGNGSGDPEATRLAGTDATRLAAPAGGAGPAADPARQIGPYRLLRKLGGGGMGQIFLAVQESVGREVALKVLPPGSHDDPQAVERFRREVRALGQLSHPHICPVIEAGESGGVRFYAMEYLRGIDLARVLRTQRVDPRRAAEIAAQVARALQHAHDHGIVHRDVKPLNVMLVRGRKARAASSAPNRASESGSGEARADSGDARLPSPDFEDHAYLIDFGLARDGTGSSALTATGDVLGTPAYMAPEQARGEQRAIGPATDVYSLGATLYEMLALRPPFVGSDPAHIVRQVADSDPPPVRAANAAVDRDLETVVQKAMEKDPARRYASAAAFADDLDRWLAGEHILARRASLLYRARRRIARNRLATAAVAGALALAAWGAWRFMSPGTLDLAVSPEGAFVTVDGVRHAPGRIRVWPPRRVAVRVEREGFATREEPAVVASRSTTPLDVRLVSTTGTLAVASNPPGARVLLDGIPSGTTPVRIVAAVGPHRLDISLPGHVTSMDAPVVRPGEETFVRADLRHEQGGLSLTSEPNEVAVELWRDGTPGSVVAAAPSPGLPLDTGHWRGVARARNRFPRTFEFDLAAGQTVRRHLTLNPMVAWQFAGAPGNRCAAAADLDHDGDTDLVLKTGGPERVTALDGKSGRVLWVADLEGFEETTRHSLVLADFDGDLAPEVAVHDRRSLVRILDGATGRRLREFASPDADLIQEAGDLDGDAGPDILVLGDSEVAAVSGRSGRLLWRRPMPGDRKRACVARFAGAEGRDAVVLGPGRGLTRVSGRTGEIVWEARLGTDGEPQVLDLDGDGAPDAVSAPLGSGELAALGARDGKVLWRRKIAGVNTRAADLAANLDGDPSVEIVRSAGDDVVIVDGKTGDLQARLRLDTGWGPALPLDLTGDGRRDLLIPSNDTLAAFDGDTLEPLWRFYADGPVNDAPLAGDFDGDGRQDVAVFSTTGHVAVLAAESPPVLWKQSAPQWHTDRVAPAGGVVLAPSRRPMRVLRAADGGAERDFGAVSAELASTTIVNGTPIAVLPGDPTRCMDCLTGRVIWESAGGNGNTAPDLVDLDADGWPEAIGGDDRLGRDLTALDGRTGRVLWTSPLRRTHRARLAFAGGTLWVPSADGLHAVDPADGKTRFTLPLRGGCRSVLAFGDDLVFATGEGRLVRAPLPKPRLSPKWDLDLGLDVTPQSPVAGWDRFFAVRRDGLVAAVDAATGRFAWRTPLGRPTACGLAVRDLDGDGLDEVAACADDSTVAVLRGTDGRAAWTTNLGGTFGAVTPAWSDLDADGAPDVVVPCRDGYLYALRPTLRETRVETWRTREVRSVGEALEAGAAEAALRRIREALRESRLEDAVREAEAVPSAAACCLAAFAAERLGDPARALRLAEDARARGCRRLDVETLRASLLPAGEGAASLAEAFASLPLDQLAAAGSPSRPALFHNAAVHFAARSGPHDERRVLVAALTGDWSEVAAAFDRAAAAGADPGRLFLARARAALLFQRDDSVLSDLREALAHPSSRDDAAREFERAVATAHDLAVRGVAAWNAQNYVGGLGLLNRAIRLNPDGAENWNGYAYILATTPGATPEQGRRAVEAARRALDIHRRTAPDDAATLGLYLDTLAAAHFAAGEYSEAAAAQREALTQPIDQRFVPDMKKALEKYEKAANR